MFFVFRLLLLSLFLKETLCVDHGKFKKCDQISFCKRQRDYKQGTLSYSLTKPLVTDGFIAKTTINETVTNTEYNVEVSSYQDNIFRLTIKETNPLKPRYEVQEVLLDSISQTGLSVTVDPMNPNSHIVTLNDADDIALNIDYSSLRFDVSVAGKKVISVNSRGLFYFEHTRDRESAPEIPGINMENAWDESFGGDHDTRKNGPQSVGVDISFINFENVYGIPEHATDFSLKTTRGNSAQYSEPYRLYNFDVFEYELDQSMALYGHVPFMMAHSVNQTVGVFWLNAAETWVDVEKTSEGAASESLLSSFFGGNSGATQLVNTHWMSETGIIDIFFFVGPTPKDIFRQFSSLVGKQALPPLFAISFHQCRWNYQDEDDVRMVNNKFEEHDIPYDVLWLDIEHTDGKRYFTWDGKTFPEPEKMINEVASYGRKMVTIVDPHIKRDDGYYVHSKATALGHYIKDSENRDYDGHCWPGSSGWIDYLSPAARDFWAEQFKYENYKGSTPSLFTWNDMNEPSIFNGPEVTMKKNALHYGGWEHRDVHNIYGMLMHRATSEGLVKRNEGANKRSFVLSRAFYAGTQRWGAIWTGDNKADWGHLEASVPMLLSMGVSGIVFSGADVGGFFGNPEPELILRWSQVAAYQPFFRAHAHMDTKRREPWVYGEPWTNLIGNAIAERYTLLPYLYTLFWEASQTGTPVMRPLWAEFNKDAKTFQNHKSFLLGNALLVTPVVAAGQVETTVYLPTDTTEPRWYDLANDNKEYAAGNEVTVSTPLHKISVFQRGGTIVPRKFRRRRSSAQMQNDPVTLIVALDSQGNSTGELFLDDGDSFNWQTKKEYYHLGLAYTTENTSKSTLSSFVLHKTSEIITSSTVERIIVLGAVQPRKISVDCNGVISELQGILKGTELVVKKPNCLLTSPFVVTFEF